MRLLNDTSFVLLETDWLIDWLIDPEIVWKYEASFPARNPTYD
jgi:hypothetical protein